MSELLHFNINQGRVECECMERTHNFISGNLSYLEKSLAALKGDAFSAKEFTMVCYESTMSFAVKVDRVELGQIASGEGRLLDGSSCGYDEIMESLSA